ncbi:MAG: hypothetical protein AAF696_12975 [Bacteroidota bacterium]
MDDSYFNQLLSQEEFELMEAYLLDKLPIEKKQSFEARLQQDKALAKQLAGIKELILGSQLNALQQKLDMFHEDIDSQSAKVISLGPPRWVYALVASLALLVAIFIWKQSPRLTEDKLFSEYFQPDPGLVTAMSANQNYEFNKAMVEYKSGAYEKALKSWMALLEQKPQNDSLNYYIAMAKLSLQEVKAALPYLEELVKNEASGFHKDANWYLGLSYLKMARFERAKIFLKSSQHPKSEELIEKLNQPE